MEPLNQIDLATRVPDEATAWEVLESIRWQGRPVCSHCGVVGGHYYLKPRNGERQTRKGAVTYRRLWKCHACRRQFSVLTGTVMHRSKVPVRTWLFVMFDIASCKNGVSAREVERRYGLTPRTAWFVVHRLREAMLNPVFTDRFVGTIEMDETYVGGRKSWKGRRKGYPFADKAPVVTMVERETGRARSQVVERVTGKNVREMIERHADRVSAVLYTDQAGVYARVGPRHVRKHEIVNHAAREYVRGAVSTNTVEGFFSQLKRSLDGTHHHVTPTHLHRYVAEFDFRYSTRDMADGQRMADLVRRTRGRRLTYRESASEPSASVLVA